MVEPQNIDMIIQKQGTVMNFVEGGCGKFDKSATPNKATTSAQKVDT